MSAFTSPIWRFTSDPNQSNKVKKRNKSHRDWKERNKTQAADSMICPHKKSQRIKKVIRNNQLV